MPRPPPIHTRGGIAGRLGDAHRRFWEGVAMEQNKRVVIAEDHTLLRQSLRTVLEGGAGLRIVAEAADGFEAIRSVEKHRPDLLLLDLSMPKLNGISVIKEVKRRNPQVKVLVLTIHDTEDYVRAVFESGADGYCMKDAEIGELLDAVKHILAGKTYLSPKIADRVLSGLLTPNSDPGRHPWEKLSQREKEILKLIAEGYKSGEIGDLLCISTRTVEKHRSNIMKKLDIHNIASLTAYAMEKGLPVSAAA